MSDIQEQIKLAHKRAEENDYKKECFKRLEYTNKYSKYSEEDLIEEIIEKDKEIEKLQDRINKAIEYINNNSLYEEEYDYDYEENIHLSGTNDTKARNDLLDILQGSDRE